MVSWYGELVLAAPDTHPLRDPGLSPDPLTPIANFFDTLDHGTENVEVQLNLWPIPPDRVRRHRTRQIDALKKQQVPGTKDSSAPNLKWLEGTVSTVNAAFTVLIAAEAPTVARAQSLVTEAATQFTAYSNGQLQGLVYDAGRYRTRRAQKRLAARFRQPIAAAARPRRWLPADTLAGILKPATAKCEGEILRGNPLAGLPPRDILHFDASALRDGLSEPSAELIPWGIDQYRPDRVLAVAEEDTYFTWTGGTSGYGKTETTMARFVYLARAGHGCLLLDPHSDAVEKVKPYLTPVADRVVELALDRVDPERVVTWNPFDVPSVAAEYAAADSTPAADPTAAQWQQEIAAARDVICGMYFGYMGWEDNKQTRAVPMLTAAVTALLNVVPSLPREDRPTLFTVLDILNPYNEGFRDAVTSRLVERLQSSYWTTQFDNESKDAWIAPTRPLSTFAANPLLRAVVGSSVAGFRMAELMDARKVVLVKIGGGQEQKKFLASMVLHDVIAAMFARRTRPPDERSTFHVFCDEAPDYDGPVAGKLEEAINQCRKYGLRLHLISQYIDGIAERTKEALTANRTHLMTSSSNPSTARWFVSATASGLHQDAVIRLPRYHFVTEVAQGGLRRPPFNCAGMTMSQLFGPPAPAEEVAELQATIDTNSRLKPTGRVAELFDTLPERVKHRLALLPAPSVDGGEGWDRAAAHADSAYFDAQVPGGDDPVVGGTDGNGGPPDVGTPPAAEQEEEEGEDDAFSRRFTENLDVQW